MPRSLRMQLALFGAAAILLPLVTLLVVVFATVEESSIEQDVTVTATTIDVDSDALIESRQVSPWVPLTVLALSVPAGLTVWWWSRRAVQPIKDITAVANEIQAGSLDQRIGLAGAPVEVQSLASSFDAMLDRLTASSETQKRLIEDVNHELKTPLAALAVNAEVMLRAPDPTTDDYRSSARRTATLVRRMQTTIESLLADARTRQHLTHQVNNDLVAIIGRVIEQHQTLSPGRTISLEAEESAWLGIDGHSVERAISNLVDNAVRYSPPDSSIEIIVTTDDAQTSVQVIDHGPGLLADEADRIFDRYYRGPRATGDGTGIGLALVKQVADAYGSVTVESPISAEGGSRFILTFVQ